MFDRTLTHTVAQLKIVDFSLVKETVYYGKEAEKEQARHDKMKADGADEYQLKKQVFHVV